MNNVGAEFVDHARQCLSKEFAPRIEQCVETLTDADVWWRAHETDNSIGNLILHLSGNVRQWIISGLGGAASVRDRPKEFSERVQIPRQELLKLFSETVREADTVLERFDLDKLLEVRHFQKWDHTCLYAIAHVVEHMAEHMGQIIYITKLKTAKDLKFFKL